MAPASQHSVVLTPPTPNVPVSMGSRNPFRNSTESKRNSGEYARRGSIEVSKDGSTTTTTHSRGPSNEVKRKPVLTSVQSGVPTPPQSGQFPTSPYRQDAFSSYEEKNRRRSGELSPRGSRSRSTSNTQNTHSRSNSGTQGPRSRGNSMNQTPLEAAKFEAKLAHKSPHLKKHHIPGPDVIDKLDVGPGGAVHHEGPYDAVLLARNLSLESSPVAAVRSSNREAIRATPRENIMDSLEKHKPLDGTAAVPPGTVDRFGRPYQYKEGDNMMTSFGGDYKRWPDVVRSPTIFGQCH